GYSRVVFVLWECRSLLPLPRGPRDGYSSSPCCAGLGRARCPRPPQAGAEAMAEPSAHLQVPPCFVPDPAEAPLPLSVRQAPVTLLSLGHLADLQQELGTVPQDLRVGRLRLVGQRIRSIAQLEVTFLTQHLGQAEPRSGFAGPQADGRGQVLPGEI